jgi:hypothetical protein
MRILLSETGGGMEQGLISALELVEVKEEEGWDLLQMQPR